MGCFEMIMDEIHWMCSSGYSRLIMEVTDIIDFQFVLNCRRELDRVYACEIDLGWVGDLLMEMFHTSPEDLSTLRMKVSDPSAPDHQAAQRLGEAIQGAMTKRLSDAKGVYLGPSMIRVLVELGGSLGAFNKFKTFKIPGAAVVRCFCLHHIIVVNHQIDNELLS